MKRYSSALKEHFKSTDYVVLLCAVAMTLIGILTLSGMSSVLGTRNAVIHSLATCVGLVFAFVISLFDYEEVVDKLWLPFLLVTIGLLVAVKLFGFAPNSNSDQRNWLGIPGTPLTFQPSEFVKITYILVFAKHLSVVKHKINKITTVLLLALHAGFVLGLLYLTGDLGMVVIYACITAAMLYSAGLSLWYFAAALLIFVIAIPYLWPRLDYYQQMRILCGFNPSLDPDKYGYNALRSIDAIKAGGFRGAGFAGNTAWPKVPVAYADFIFCVVAEKFGFFGTCTYIVLMTVMIFRLIHIARKARKNSASFIVIGFATMLMSQTVINIGMSLGMLPVVGLTLPFVSSGGTSLLATYMAIGVIESVASHNKKYYFERENG